jgi:PAS domain S-box-containing protein/putative nucleotidyltransferase with HDIG domain
MGSNALERVLGRAPLPVQRLSVHGVIIAVNRRWEELTGYSASEVAGRAFRDLVPHDHHDDFQRTFAMFAETGELNGVDCYMLTKSGETLNVRVYGQFLVDEGYAECMVVDITELRRAERELRESQERYRSLFEHQLTPVLVHDGASVLVANAACAEYLGYANSEDMADLPVVELVHPDDRAVVAERVKRMMLSDWTAPPVTERLQRKDGSTVLAEVSASPVILGGRRVIHVVAVDLSEQMETEKALAESEDRFRILFEYSGEAIVVHDGGRVRLANRAARRQFGIADDVDATEFSLFEFVHPDYVEHAKSRISSLLKGEPQGGSAELKLLKADGTIWWAEAHSAVLPIEGEVYVSTMLRDLTERKCNEEEVAGYRVQLERLLEERTERLQQLERQLDAVTTVVGTTVEMRDPYTAGHQRRVAALALAVAEKMGMSAEDLGHLEVAAHLHDVGKVSVPAEILSRPSKLSVLEFELVKTHVEAGYSIVRSADLPAPVAEIVYQHHERIDGSGYPRGLDGDDLLLGAKILMVADVVEAMCTHRPYRPAFGFDAALKEIASGRGRVYDADVVDACLEVIGEGFTFVDEF